MNLVTRALEFRAAEEPTAGGHATLTGRAVPYGVETEIIPGFWEVIEPGAARMASEEGIPLFWRHHDPIGLIPTGEEREDGFWIVDAHISDTSTGRDARTLLADGAVRKLSIGFQQVRYTDEEREDGSILRRQHEIVLHEVSLVPFPAYADADITESRHRKDTLMTTTADTASTATADVEALAAELREMRAELRGLATPTAPAPVETRTAGQLLQDAVRGDEGALEALREAHQRSFAGTKAADGLGDAKHPTWAKDLVRIIDTANPFAKHFATAPLPGSGMHLEFGRLAENTVQVGKQAKEGDALPTGKVTVKSDTVPVATYGGGVELSRQTIERSPYPLLDRHLKALALSAGQQMAAAVASRFEAEVKERNSAALSIAKAATALTWADLSGLLIDAAKTYSEQGFGLDGLAVNVATFKALAALTDTTGRPILSVSGTGVNSIGTLNASTTADALGEMSLGLSSLRIVPHFAATSDGMGTGVAGAFFTRDALVLYQSPLARLQDQEILTLTGSWAVYFYAAIAPENPLGLVPLKIGG